MEVVDAGPSPLAAKIFPEVQKEMFSSEQRLERVDRFLEVARAAFNADFFHEGLSAEGPLHESLAPLNYRTVTACVPEGWDSWMWVQEIGGYLSLLSRRHCSARPVLAARVSLAALKLLGQIPAEGDGADTTSSGGSEEQKAEGPSDSANSATGPHLQPTPPRMHDGDPGRQAGTYVVGHGLKPTAEDSVAYFYGLRSGGDRSLWRWAWPPRVSKPALAKNLMKDEIHWQWPRIHMDELSTGNIAADAVSPLAADAWQAYALALNRVGDIAFSEQAKLPEDKRDEGWADYALSLQWMSTLMLVCKLNRLCTRPHW